MTLFGKISAWSGHTLILIIIIALCLNGFVCSAQTCLSPSGKGRDVFPLVTPRSVATVYHDPDDYTVVGKSAGLFAGDILEVTGKTMEVTAGSPADRYVVIAGTIEKNSYIRRLAEQGKIDTSPLRGAWERYIIRTVPKPFPGIDKALVVAGSDRRGAAYGLLALSELAGISPWHWWADVPAAKHSAIYIDAPGELSPAPSVKYRGIFINDEDWGLKPWAAKTFEPERGNIGPRTYARVCELLLRLKANYLAPAMHPVSAPFYSIAENKLVADSFAIVMGSSHCEPLLLNTASEWDSRRLGPWNYDVNKARIDSVLDSRVAESCAYENVYTLALRGLHDGAMNGDDASMQAKVRRLGAALKAQRDIVAAHHDTAVENVPQAFTPYKEVLEIYDNGLVLPDDVTIMWPDDNFGYMKRLSGPREQKRSGRSGVYYHLSYLGVPHSYLWFSTTPPALMYEELRKAYDTTADRIWLANVGDIKGCEMQMSLFLDMAYDIERFNAQNVVTYPARWLAGMFGSELYPGFEDVYLSHISLAFARKPEYMGWGYWNNCHGIGEKRTDTEFSFDNYGEAYRRLNEYGRISAIADSMLATVAENARPALFELFCYPVKGAALMNAMTMGGQLYRKYVREGRNGATVLKKKVECLHDSLEKITDTYNSLLDGKWRHMMSLRQNYDGSSSYFMVPLMEDVCKPDDSRRLGISVEGESRTEGTGAFRRLPVFNRFSQPKYHIDIFSRGKDEVEWKATVSQPWIVLSDSTGNTSDKTRIYVSVDWDKAPEQCTASGTIEISGGGSTETILVSTFSPEGISDSDINGLFMEDNGYVSIPAHDFHRKYENEDIKIDILPGIGIEGSSLRLGNPTAPLQCYRDSNVPRVEYDFYTFNAGIVDMYTYVLPTFPLHAERDFKLPENNNSDTKYSVRIDDGSIATPSTSAGEYTQLWYESVLRNCRVNKSTLYVRRPGKHTLQIRCGDPGTVIQKIVIDTGGMSRSYLGPQSTKFVMKSNKKQHNN